MNNRSQSFVDGYRYKNIVSWLKRTRMSMTVLAEATGYNRSSLYRYLGEKPTHTIPEDLLHKISDMSEISVAELSVNPDIDNFITNYVPVATGDEEDYSALCKAYRELDSLAKSAATAMIESLALIEREAMASIVNVLKRDGVSSWFEGGELLCTLDGSEVLKVKIFNAGFICDANPEGKPIFLTQDEDPIYPVLIVKRKGLIDFYTFEDYKNGRKVIKEEKLTIVNYTADGLETSDKVTLTKITNRI